jgi:hypothetical protein
MLGLFIGLGLGLLVLALVVLGFLGFLINEITKEDTTCDKYACKEDKIKDSAKNDTKCSEDKCEDECCLELVRDSEQTPLPFDEQTVNPNTDSDIQAQHLGGFLFNDENYLIPCSLGRDPTCKSDTNREKVEISDKDIESYVYCDDASDVDSQYKPRLVYANDKENVHVYCEKIGV